VARYVPDEPADAARRLARVADLTGAVFAERVHEELLVSLLDTTLELFDAAAASVAVLDDADEALVYEAAVGAGADEIIGTRLPLDRGIAGWVLVSGQAAAIGDVADDPRFARDVAERSGYVPTSILAAPLETDRRPLGVLQVLDAHGGGAASADDLALLALVARQARLAVEGSRVVADLGQVLLDALASADDGDLAGALREIERSSVEPRRELAAVAAMFAELDARGDREAEAARSLVERFLAYVRARDALR
jgi:GAF domain-containing protein